MPTTHLARLTVRSTPTGEEKIPNDEVLNNDIDGAGNSYLRSYYIDASDGKSECQTAFSQGVSLWGYGDLGAALKAWGYTEPTGSSNDWTAPKPGETTAKALRDRIYSGGQPILGAADAYVYWSKSLGAACQLSNPNEYATATAAEKIAVDRTGQTDYVKVKEVKPDLSGTVEMIYTIGSDSHVNSYVMPVNSPLYKPTGYSCQQMADLVTKAAPGYIIYAKEKGIVSAPSGITQGTNPAGSGEKTCKIDGIGWLLCPVVKILASISDSAKGQLDNLLRIDTTQIFKTTDTAGTAYSYWKVMRNYANVIFVLLFLFIVYSQLTSVGLSNYGIKKLLPKMVLVALLVNISFFICALAVDLSNFFGAAAFNFISGAAGAPGTGSGSSGFATGTSGFADIGGKAILLALGGAIAYFALASVIGMLIFVTIASVTVLFILGIRQALVILLVVLSPLAFVAMLLPNTEGLFKKWWGLFKAMLLLYPIIGLLYGAGKLASTVLNGTSGASPDGIILLQITAAFLLFAPLIFTYLILKGALAGLGAVNGFINKAQSGAQGKTNKLAQERLDNSALMRGRALRKEGKKTYKDRQFGRAVAGVDTSRMGRLRRRAAGGALGGRTFSKSGEFAQTRMEQTARSRALNEEDKEYEENVKAASLDQAGLDNSVVAAMAATGHDAAGRKLSEHELAAANDRVMKSGSFSERRGALSYLASHKDDDHHGSSTLRNRAVQGAYAKGDQNIYGAGFGNNLVSDDPNNASAIASEADLAAAAVANAAAGSVSAEHMVQGESSTRYLVDQVIASGDATARANLSSAATAARIGTGTAGKISSNIDASFTRL